jgi:hypothetical protein
MVLPDCPEGHDGSREMGDLTLRLIEAMPLGRASAVAFLICRKFETEFVCRDGKPSKTWSVG